MPVFNGEQSIGKAIEAILSQTYPHFELIVSDNASTDSTQLICKEYARKDTRIRYIRQNENNGIFWNFNFVLHEARCDYFVWHGSDDFWEPNFLEKNVKMLESDSSLVGSRGEVRFYDPNDVFGIYKHHITRLSGTYEEKVKYYLKFLTGTNVMSVYRTKCLQKGAVHKPMSAWDWAVDINALKYGDVYVFDEVLMYRFPRGRSSERSMFRKMHLQNVSLLDTIFLNMPFTTWCAKNLGSKIFLKNMGYFAKLVFDGELITAKTLAKILIAKIQGKDAYTRNSQQKQKSG